MKDQASSLFSSERQPLLSHAECLDQPKMEYYITIEMGDFSSMVHQVLPQVVYTAVP